MLLSLGSGTFCQAPTLFHISRGGGSNCPTRWSRLSDKVVPIVRQGGSNCPTKVILSESLDHFSAKIQAGPNSPTRWF